jgi:hypothetical protein
MAHVRSTAHSRSDAPMQEAEGAAVEMGAFDETCDSAGSVERFGPVHASDAGSQSNAEGNSDEGSCSYNSAPRRSL